MRRRDLSPACALRHFQALEAEMPCDGWQQGFLEEIPMREQRVTLPELALVAGTRAMLGAGLGLLLAGRLNDDQRRAAGWTLFVVGALTTIPLAIEVFGTRDSLPKGEPRGLTERSETGAMPAQA
jgi:hypothetical protein